MHAGSIRSARAKRGCHALVQLVVLCGCGDEVAAFRDGGAAIATDANTVTGLEKDGGLTKIDRSHLAQAGTAPFNYADPALWMCRPGNDPDECLSGLDATELLKDGSQRRDKHVPATAPGFDCFYIYPTVHLTEGGNATDLSQISYARDALLTQAARFNRICQVYAPLYRQRTFNQQGELTGDAALAQADVDGAFHYYLQHLNRGRNYVLIGHSQGTGLLTNLIAREIDGNEVLRARMISALLIGGTIAVPEGRDVGGTFQNLPLCRTPGQTHCVVAFASFAKEVPPSPTSTRTGLGRDPAGMLNGCTNPSSLAGNTGRYRGSYLPVMATLALFVPNLPNPALSVPTMTVLVRDFFRGECIHRDGLGYLEVWPDPSADDRRAVPAYRYAIMEQIGAGMHTGDFSVVLDDLIDAVELQAQAMP